MSVQEDYAALRAHLRQHPMIGALTAVYRFFLFLQFDTQLPAYLDNPAFRGRSKIDIGLFEWELETLIREMVLHCPLDGSGPEFDYSAFAKAVNLVKRTENAAWGTGRRGPDIFYELMRIAHRQFRWQSRFDQDDLVRFYRLHRHPDVDDLIQQTFGMTCRDLYAIGMGLAGHFLHSIHMVTPVTNSLNAVTATTVNAFVERFALPLDRLQSEIAALESLDVNWAYTFNPLKMYPLIRLTPTLVVAPIPPLLLHRLSDGVYFDLVNLPGFANAFGTSFQQYVGDVVGEVDTGRRLNCIPEQRYGTKKRPRDSTDWIVEDDTASLFIECKAGRMRFQGKSDLANRDAMDAEVSKLAGFVVQSYATLADALDGRYPHWQPVGDKPIYPLVVTLDEWHAFGDLAERIIDGGVRRAFADRGLDHRLLNAYPYEICSIQDFELLMQIASQTGIDAVMSRKRAEAPKWPFHNFLVEFCSEHDVTLRGLFGADFEELGPDWPTG